MPGFGMQDAGCKLGVRVFQWPGSVFGARCPALGVDSVPGIGFQVPGPGTWNPYLIPNTEWKARIRLGSPVHVPKNPHTG